MLLNQGSKHLSVSTRQQLQFCMPALGKAHKKGMHVQIMCLRVLCCRRLARQPKLLLSPDPACCCIADWHRSAIVFLKGQPPAAHAGFPLEQISIAFSNAIGMQGMNCCIQHPNDWRSTVILMQTVAHSAVPESSYDTGLWWLQGR